jgi:hypothetical protein
VTDRAVTELGTADDQLRRLLERADAFAASHLEGINEAAVELAQLTDQSRVMARAVRIAVERVRCDPSRANKQVASLIRRAIELGMYRWKWVDTKPVP